MCYEYTEWGNQCTQPWVPGTGVRKKDYRCCPNGPDQYKCEVISDTCYYAD